jgi:xanthine/uracil permease
MNGVEILNQYQVAGDLVCNDEAAIIAFFLFCGIVTFASIITSIYEQELFYAVIGSLLGLCFGIIVSMIVGIATAQPGELETYCQVTIDDSVSFNEFQQKYEIIEQEGQIYTVKAKIIE